MNFPLKIGNEHDIYKFMRGEYAIFVLYPDEQQEELKDDYEMVSPIFATQQKAIDYGLEQGLFTKVEVLKALLKCSN